MFLVMTRLLISRDKNIDSLKFLLALRIYNEPFTVAQNDGQLLQIKRSIPGSKKDAWEFYSADAATRYLSGHNDVLSDSWIEWACGRKFMPVDLKHLEDKTHELKVIFHLIKAAAPCTPILFASLFFTSLADFPKLSDWFKALKASDTYAKVIKEWETVHLYIIPVSFLDYQISAISIFRCCKCQPCRHNQA